MYHNPEKCTHPKRLERIQIIYEDRTNVDKSYTIAKLFYKSGETAIGMRWNIAYDQYKNEDCKQGRKVCLGFPHSRGYPTWFILPENTEFNQRVIINP